MAEFLRLVFNSLETGSVYALAALGIVLIFRTSKTTNFAQGMIGTLNAYVAAFMATRFNLHIVLVTMIALFTAFITGVIIDLLTIRPAKKVLPVSKQIITLGIIMVILGLIPFMFGIDNYQLASFFPTGNIVILGAALRYNTIFIILISLMIMGSMFYIIQKTRWGLAIRVTASDETTSRLMGVPTKTVTMFAWAFAAMMATLAGIFVAPRVAVSPNMLLNVQISAFFASTLGGFSSFLGPVIGSYLIAFLRNFTRFYIDDVWGNVMVYMGILVFLYFKPYGLFGKKPVKKV
jgi:branched-chain amino acid transport system permease protein